MRFLIIIIITVSFNKCYSQDYTFAELNDKTINSYLTKDEFILDAPFVGENGMEFYSSHKNEKSSVVEKHLTVKNGYTLGYDFRLTTIKNKTSYEDINNTNKTLYKAYVEDGKKKYNIAELEVSNDNEFKSKLDFSKKDEIINAVNYKFSEDENNLYYYQHITSVINVTNYPFLNGIKGFNGEEISFLNVSPYNIAEMIKLFIKDLKFYIDENVKNNLINANSKKAYEFLNKLNDNQIKATFEEMDNGTLAISYGINDDKNIIVKVNPLKWAEASNQKKWYIIYHELGHDILNLHHGEGDKMMFNFIDKKYSWNDFFEDRKKMFDIYFSRNLIKTNNNLKIDTTKINNNEINQSIATVTIGNQKWTAKNLNVNKYRNGDIIPEVKDLNEWNALTTGAWCYYNNDPDNGAIYGKLYNWYAVNDTRGLAPEGFHIPKIAELEMVTDLKDPIGFAGLPGGLRSRVGDTFIRGGIIAYGWWWSSSENDTDYAWCRSLNYNLGSSSKIQYNNKINGNAVRCLKD